MCETVRNMCETHKWTLGRSCVRPHSVGVLRKTGAKCAKQAPTVIWQSGNTLSMTMCALKLPSECRGCRAGVEAVEQVSRLSRRRRGVEASSCVEVGLTSLTPVTHAIGLECVEAASRLSRLRRVCVELRRVCVELRRVCVEARAQGPTTVRPRPARGPDAIRVVSVS